MTPLRVLFLAIASGLTMAALASGGVGAQGVDPFAVQAEPGAPGEPDELRAWQLVRAKKLVEAREAGQEIVAERPDSALGHFVLAHAYHYGEANFPRALHHAKRAIELFEAEHGRYPPDTVSLWHRRMLFEVAQAHGDLDHYQDQLTWFGRFDEVYDPDTAAARAWPLMKLRRFDAARQAALEGLDTGQDYQVEIALNALCAIEFEAGDDDASYAACRRALQHAKSSPGGANAVDLTNFAEAARAAFRLDEAERTLLEATEASPAWYGNPWLELGELYTRGGRFAEALQALQKVQPYRAARPPHVQDSDRNESRRALAAFYLAIGRFFDARSITEKALVMPDRRSHNSRDPFQDRAVVALVDRSAQRGMASQARESAAALGLWERTQALGNALALRFGGWMSGRQAVQLLADEDRLVGTFQIGTSRAAIVPPWIVGELVEVAGAAVVDEAAALARASDERAPSGAYYDAFQSEAAWRQGDEERALELAERASGALGDGEALLRARVDAIRAAALMARDGAEAATPAFERVLQHDPGVLRRLEIPLPVRVEASADSLSQAVRDGVTRSPRFDVGNAGLLVSIEPSGAGVRACLLSASRAVLGCGDPGTVDPTASEEARAQTALDRLHQAAFAPRVDLSQADIGSLDGSLRTVRDPLDTLFGR